MALREPLADFRDRQAGAVGGHADVDDEGVHRPHPEVVDPPPRDLVQQTGIDTRPGSFAAALIANSLL